MFVFEPYVGTIPIRFGMTPTEVGQIVGLPLEVTTNYLGERDEERLGYNVRYSKEKNTLVEVSVLPSTLIYYDSRNLFEEEDLIQSLILHDPEPYVHVGFIIFLQIGLMVAGFHDNDVSQQGITAFVRNRLNPYRNHFSRFRK